MAASSSDLFMEVGDPGTATTLSAPGYTIGGTSLTVGSTANWPTTTGVIFAMDEVETVDGVETEVEGSYNEYAGVVASGTSITGVTHVRGTDQNFAAGTSTRVYIPVSAERENRIAQGMVAEHNQDGTHAAVTATTVTTTGKITAGNSLQMTAGTLTLPAASINQTALPLGSTVQMVYNSDSAVATGTTTIPGDDTIPQNTEGTQFMSQAITPLSATNILVIECDVQVSGSASGLDIIGALFQGTTANALAARQIWTDVAGRMVGLTLKYVMVAGTTSATTFKLRIGGSSASTITFNGATGARKFGAIPKSSMTITEYKA